MSAGIVRTLFFSLIFFVSSEVSIGQVSITGFAPEAGSIGTLVTISGADFHPNPDSNIVFFGNIRATVIGSNATSISVKVPAGTGNDMISIARSGYLAVSQKTFSVTHSCNDIYANSFAPKIDKVHNTEPTVIATGDLDGDGKPDVVIGNKFTYNLSIYRNNSGRTGSISYETPVIFGISQNPSSLTIADINGDGKQDIIITSTSTSGFTILKNEGSPNNIYFTYTDFFSTGSGSGPIEAAVSDFNNDGKPDIAIACLAGNRVRVFTQYLDPQQGNTYFFFTSFDLTTGSAPSGIIAADLNDDNKNDLVVTNNGSNNISIYRNITSGTTPSFAAATNAVTATGPKSIYSRDLDGDGKTDLAIVTTNSVSLFKNRSTALIVFDPGINIAVGGTASDIIVQNFDGDGKPDIAVTNKTTSNIALFKNASSVGAIAFDAPANFITGTGADAIAAADMDIDGRIDLLSLSIVNPGFSIIRSNAMEPVVTSFTPASATTGETITVTGTNFTGISSVKFNGTPAASFNVISPVSMNIVVGNGSTGELTISNACGTAIKSGFIFSGTPAIASFTPLSGLVGATIVITGSNFNSSSPASNIVRFGTAVATVTAATTSSLTVRVPAGAASGPVSVTTSGLTVYSSSSFLVDAVACNLPLSRLSFDSIKYFNSGSGSWGMATGDLDGDGKSDIAYGNFNSAAGYPEFGTDFTYHRNVSEPGNISLLPGVSLYSGEMPDDAVMKDFDGDGKLDVIIINNDYNNPLSVFRNISSPGNIQFAPRETAGIGLMASKLNTCDIDNDGKIDLLATYGGISGVRILKNISGEGNIQFAAPYEIPLESFGYDGFTATSDINGDDLIDIIVVNPMTDMIRVLKNKSTPEEISFETLLFLPTGRQPHSVTLSDIDGDGKVDIINANYRDTIMSIFRNTSAGGITSFASRFDYKTSPINSSSLIFTDQLDGDTKPDIFLLMAGAVGIIRNLSTPGNIILDTLIKFPVYAGAVLTTDMDNDGKQDIIAVGGSSNGKISVLRNRLCEDLILCPNGSNSITANMVGDAYQWQVDTGSGYTDLSDNSNYTGATTRTLQLSNIPSTFYGYRYRCLVDGMTTAASILKFENTWTGAISNNWDNPGNWSCLALPDANTDVIISSGNVLLNISTTIRSLTINSGATVTVIGGNILTVTH